MIRRIGAILQIGLVLPHAACGAGWHRIEPEPPATLRPRQQVQVWQGETPVRLHAVTVTADSLSGVPYLQSPNCDSCRVSLSRQSVDSIRSGNPTSGFWKTVGLTIGGMIVAALVICAAGTTCQLQAD